MGDTAARPVPLARLERVDMRDEDLGRRLGATMARRES